MSHEIENVNKYQLEATKELIINRNGIGFFKAILESYEDIAIFSVLDGKAGIIEIVYPIYFEKDIIAIMIDMKNYGIELKENGNV